MTEDAAPPPVVVLTGPPGAGKTTLLERLVAAAGESGRTTGGLLTPARLQAGRKTGILVADAASGERRLLASAVPGELHGAALGRWIFDDDAIAWGNAVLERALPCDLLVIDELGPLEFDRHQGWSQAFRLIAAPSGYRLCVVVVRPAYCSAFLRRFSRAGTVTLHQPGDVEAGERVLAALLLEER